MAPGTEHVTIAVSGAYGGNTINFRRLSGEGMTLLGLTQEYKDGKLTFAPDLGDNIASGDANYMKLLDDADAYVKRNGIDLPEEPEARKVYPEPDCISNPVRELDLADANITTILWATGFRQDFDWMKVDAFDEAGTPKHQRGVSSEPGIFFLGLPWQSRRGSSFIWGVWHDAKHVADHIATQRKYRMFRPPGEANQERRD